MVSPFNNKNKKQKTAVNNHQSFARFNLMRYFIQEEKLAGLEISDLKIRVALLDKDKKDRNRIKINIFGEEDLEEGIIKEGKVLNTGKLADALKKLWKKTALDKERVFSVVLSISPRNFFTQLFQFPRRMSSEEIDNAMNLNVEFSVPFPPKEIYVDWENITSPDSLKQEVFFVAGPKKTIDDYLSALSWAGISAVAVEINSLSISRVIKNKNNSLILAMSFDGINSFIMERNIIRFSRFLSWSSHNIFKNSQQKKNIAIEVFFEILKDEVFRILNYYKSETGNENILDKILLIGPIDFLSRSQKILEDNFKIPVKIASFSEDFPSLPILDDNSALAVCGAALRGLISRKDDYIISLMPIGTEEAYQKQKQSLFFEFIGNFTIFLSAFFFGVLAVFYFLLFLVEKNSISVIQISEPSQNIIEAQNNTKLFNEAVEKIDFIDSQTPYFSRVVLSLKNISAPGINLKQIIINDPKEIISVSGTALTRDSLLQFRIMLEQSDFFSNVIIPLAYLERKTNVDFSMTLRIANPEKVFGTAFDSEKN